MTHLYVTVNRFDSYPGGEQTGSYMYRYQIVIIFLKHFHENHLASTSIISIQFLLVTKTNYPKILPEVILVIILF